MTVEEYFGDWMKVIDRTELLKLLSWLSSFKKDKLCPSIENVFKAFRLCPYKECKMIFIGYDPYPQKGVATGILFGNKSNTPEEQLSPSLKVIRDSVIDLEIPHNLINFDPTLESWSKQGILMLNSALTTEVGETGVHSLKWRKFTIALLNHISEINPGLIYVLFGKQAEMLKPFIGKNNSIITVAHPSHYARIKEPMPSSIWRDINKECYKRFDEKIKWYDCSD